MSSVVKEPPEATATPEPLSDEDLALDPDLYQDFCAGAFDDHGLVSDRLLLWWGREGRRRGCRVGLEQRGTGCLGTERVGVALRCQVGQCTPCLQPWMSDAEESPFLDPALRKRAVKVKHVKRREKKSEKKVMERVKRVSEEEAGTGREMETEPDMCGGKAARV